MDDWPSPQVWAMATIIAMATTEPGKQVKSLKISKSARQVSNLPFFHLTGEWQDPSTWNYGAWEEGGKVLFPEICQPERIGMSIRYPGFVGLLCQVAGTPAGQVQDLPLLIAVHFRR